MNLPNFVRKPMAAAALGAALAAPVGAVLALGFHSHAEAAMPVAGSLPSLPSSAPQMVVPNFAALVKQYGPAVVNITTKETVKTSSRAPQGLPPGFGEGDDPLSQFFGFGQMPRGRGQGGVPGQVLRGEGSGFIVGSNGVILTNAHVVADAKEVTVKLVDRREFTAKVIGQDETSDVAVLKIDAKDLPTVKLGNPDNVAVGEWVVAIGAPFGFENSVTQGIVSAKGRTLPDGSYVPFLQTDVAINPGNSGGPLFNLNGEVIGINSQIYTRSGGYQGVSFAIPIDVAMNVSQQLQTSGHVARGRIGVTVQALDGQLAQSFGLAKPEGALVAQVQKGSPGAEAGLKSGDVILSFNGADIHESSELPAQVARLAPGTKAKLGIWRDGKAKEVVVQLADMGAQEVAAADSAAAGKLGLSVRPLTKDEQKQIETEGGLLVQDVAGAAAEAGIQPGDVVLAANGKAVGSAADLKAITERASKHLALLVQRGEARLFVPVDLG